MTIPRDDPLKRRPERGPLPARGVRQQKLVEGQSVGDHEDAADPHDVYILHSEFTAAEGDMRKVAAGTYTLHKSNLNAEAAPTADDDASAGYSIGSRWIYGTSVYVCTSAGVGNANWEDLTSAGATDGDAIHDNVPGEIAAITPKASPVSGDFLVIEDSAAANAKKSITIGDLPGGGAEAHGIAAHTGHANWKMMYTDGSCDEQEVALGAAPSAALGHTYYRSAGVAAAPTMAQEMKTVTIVVESPVAADNIAISYFFQAVTIREIEHAVTAATNAIWNIEKRSTRGGAGTDINSSDFTSTTTDANATSFSSGGVSADSWLVLAVTSVSGTPAQLCITIRYTVD